MLVWYSDVLALIYKKEKKEYDVFLPIMHMMVAVKTL